MADDRSPALLFDYLRDLIYAPDKASLDLDALSPAHRDLGEGLQVLGEMLGEMRSYAERLSRGEINIPQPSKDNELAAQLKSLHASLKHITWQTARVADGDYNQKIDFMGEFAESFNRMIRELNAHKRLMDYEIDASKRKTRSLENTVSLFVALTEKIPQMILVLSDETQSVLFQNAAAKETLVSDPYVLLRVSALIMDDMMNGTLNEPGQRQCEFETGSGDTVRWYASHRYNIQWGADDATAFVMEDITSTKLNTMKLERLANVDELTKLFVRRYGMEVYEQWVEERRAFSLCFVDLDHLKYTNDTFGHDIGDIYITTASRMLSSFAPGVVAARLGGDEFMLLVPDMTEEEIVPLMDGLNDFLARAPQDIDIDDDTRSKLRFHVSFGIIEVPTDGTAVVSDILVEADKKMYEYKMAHKAARQA